MAAKLKSLERENGSFDGQMRRCVNQHHFEGGSNRAGEKMAATRRAIGQPENDVNVKAGLAVVADRYVPDSAQYLALLFDLDLFVSLVLEIEPSNRRFLESADGRERGRRKLGLPPCCSLFRNGYACRADDSSGPVLLH